MSGSRQKEPAEPDSNDQVNPPRKRRGRPPRTGVEPRQLLLIGYLMKGKSQREAAELIGVDEKTVGRWLQVPAVRQELATQLSAMAAELWGRVAADIGEVWEVFRALLRSDDERIRLRACVFFLDKVLSVLPLERLIEEARLAATPVPPPVARLLDGLADEAGGGAA